jgi:hypothetical protein
MLVLSTSPRIGIPPGTERGQISDRQALSAGWLGSYATH